MKAYMNNGKIQFVDLVAQYQTIKPEVDAAMAKVCARGDFILGEDVKLFEQEFAAFCKAPHCVTVANGTEALQLALMACGVGPVTRSSPARIPSSRPCWRFTRRARNQCWWTATRGITQPKGSSGRRR